MNRLTTHSQLAHFAIIGTGRQPQVTSVDAPPAAATRYVYLDGMRLIQREAQILTAVSLFGSLTTAQIRNLFFPEASARSTATDVLRRLTSQGMLARVSVRLPSNERGGSPMGCYQIGKTVWKSFYTSPFTPVRDQIKLMHTLAVADVYISTVQASRDGWLDILEYGVEYDTWSTVAGVELHPDLYLDVGIPALKERRRIWVEVDRSTERIKQVGEKIQRYIHAYNSDESDGDVFPEVCFVAFSSERIRELRRTITASKAPEGLIWVAELDSFPQILRSK